MRALLPSFPLFFLLGACSLGLTSEVKDADTAGLNDGNAGGDNGGGNVSDTSTGGDDTADTSTSGNGGNGGNGGVNGGNGGNGGGNGGTNGGGNGGTNGGGNGGTNGGGNGGTNGGGNGGTNGGTNGGGTNGGGTNGGSDTGGGTATCPTGGGTFDWVVSALEVGNASEGVDLDGDGAVDNVFSLAASSMNDDIATALADGSSVLVMQFWNIEDWCDDGSFQGGILIATDMDGNGADNYSGSETFDPGTNVDSSGHAVQHAAASVSGSNYSVTIPGAEVSIGGVDITTATPILIEGTASETENSGHFGFGIAVTDLVPYAESNGIDPALLYSLADLDTDGDGVGDAISAGFVFDAVSCGLR